MYCNFIAKLLDDCFEIYVCEIKVECVWTWYRKEKGNVSVSYRFSAFSAKIKV